QKATRQEVHQRWNNKVELFFNCKRPSHAKPTGAYVALNTHEEILRECGVRPKRTGICKQVRRGTRCGNWGRGKEYKGGQKQKIERKNPTSSPNIEGAKVVRRIPVIEKNSRDQKARKHEEKINTAPPQLKKPLGVASKAQGIGNRIPRKV